MKTRRIKAALPLLLALCLVLVLSACSAADVPLNGGGSSDTATELTTDTISAGGTYTLSGSYSGMITVDAGSSDVTLILNGATITNESGPAIFIKSAGNMTIQLADGTVNTLSDGSSYSLSIDGSTLDACIFSKADLEIEGSGTLIVNGNSKHGIVSKDDLVINGGTIEVTSVKSAMEGKDYVEINGGTVKISAGTDGISTSNSEDTGKGNIVVNGGTVEIVSGDDAIHAEADFTVKGGTITISKSHEGIEAVNVLVSGGTVSVTAEDDGINATSEGSIVITGGTVYVDSAGDGIDSNGFIEISGGTLLINGPASSANSSIDHDGSFTVTGGTILAIGAPGMVDGIDTAKNQAVISAYISGNAGDKITVTDASGNELVSITAERNYGHMYISSASIQTGGTYTVNINGSAAASITVSSSITNYN